MRTGQRTSRYTLKAIKSQRRNNYQNNKGAHLNRFTNFDNTRNQYAYNYIVIKSEMA